MSVSRFTENMMARFPSWMKMAKDPDSVGAQFLDVFGVTLAEFKQELDTVVDNFYIETAHTEMIDILYRMPLASETILDMTVGDTVELETFDGQRIRVFESNTLRDFYGLNKQLPRFYQDRSRGYLYLRVDFTLIEDIRNPYRAVIINGAPQYTLEIHHVWNAFDEFALLLGLTRLPGERNQNLKARILDVFENPGGVHKDGIRNGLARELGLEKEQVQVIPFHDRTFASELVKADGTPTKKMISYAKQINETLKFSWDHFNFGEAYWFSLEQENLGIDFLPHLWDVETSLFDTKEFQSGVGFKDDLLVHAPKEEASTRQFEATISLVGYYESYEELFPEIEFQYKIYAKGKTTAQEYNEQPFRYTLKAAEVFEQEYRLRAEQRFDYTFRTDFADREDFVAGTEREKFHFGLSNEILHKQTDPIVRLNLQMKTIDDQQTNRIGELHLVWEDTLGAEHKVSFETENDFLIDRTIPGGQPLTNVVYTDISHTAEGFGLGYGAFQKEVDTTLEWQQGSFDNSNILVETGAVTLNLATMQRLMN